MPYKNFRVALISIVKVKTECMWNNWNLIFNNLIKKCNISVVFPKTNEDCVS